MATSSSGCIGWMQFEPATFAEYSKLTGTTPAQPADPDDPQDAIYARRDDDARQRRPESWSTALYVYNHADWYVSQVERPRALHRPQGLSNLAPRFRPYGAASTQPMDQRTAAGTGNVTTRGAAASPQRCSNASRDRLHGRAGRDRCPTAASTRPPGRAPLQPAPVAVQAMVDAGDRITALRLSVGRRSRRPGAV